MIASIARYEFFQIVRSRQFWSVGLVFAAMAFLMMMFAGEIAGGGNININAPSNIILFTNILSLFGMFLVASLVAPSVTRDFELDSWQVVFSFPVAWKHYLLGRFTGSFLAAALCYAFVIPGFILGVHGPFAQGAAGDFNLGHYLYSFGLFALPNLFVMAAILFCVSTLTRKNLYAYAGAVLLYVLFNFGSQAMNQEPFEPLLFIVDLFGLSVVELSTRYWTPFELNSQLVPLAGDLLWNRLLWLAVGLGLLVWTLKRFDPYPRSEKLKAPPASGAEGSAPPVHGGAMQQRPIAPQVQDARAAWQQFLARSSLEIRTVIRSVPFLVLLVLGFCNALLFASLPDPVFGSPPLLITRVIINALSVGYSLALLIVVAYYSGELVWREKTVRLDQITDAMPVRNSTYFLSKLIALWAIVVALLGTAAVAMIALQLIRGTPIDLMMYIKELGYMAVPFLWIGTMAFLAQVLAPNKYVGMLVVVLYIAVSMAGPALFDYQFLTVFATHPHTDVSGLASSNFYRLEGLKYDLYWGALSAAMAMACYLLWRRGTDEGVRSRFRMARRRIHPVQAAFLIGSLVVFAGVGRWLWVEDYVNNQVPPNDNWTEATQLRYEEVLRPLENQAIPVFKSMRLEVDTFIADRKLLSRGELLLENRSNKPFEDVILGIPFEARKHQLSVDGAKLVEEFPRIRHFRYAFDRPMQPGETRKVSFDFTIDYNEFPGGAMDARLETSGTSIYLLAMSPTVGYVEFFALGDPDKRKEYGLPEQRAKRAKLGEDWGREYTALLPFGDHMSFEGIYSVDAGQTAFLSGELIGQWEKDGRSYFHYQTGPAPILVHMSVQQGRYDVLRDSIDGIDLAIHYNPEDGRHVEKFMSNFKIATKYFNDNFGRYPFDEFRIVQKAGGIGANSNSGQLTFGEFAGFISDLDINDPVDWGTHVIGHEAGHNWWGIMAQSSRTEGSHVLQETLAQYSGLMTLEHSYDRGHVARFLRHSLKKYHADRNTSKHAEVPLIRSVNETDYVHYWKGAPVIYGVKELIGEKEMNQALADYFAEWAFATGPYPTTLDLMRHLRAHTPAEYQDTLSDYFERILMHDLSITDASVEATADGKYRVTATVHTRKLERTPEGQETPVSIHEPLQIVIVDDSIDDSDRYGATVLLDDRQWFDQETTEVSFVVDSKPAAIIVDPYHNFVERNLDDNVKRLP